MHVSAPCCKDPHVPQSMMTTNGYPRPPWAGGQWWRGMVGFVGGSRGTRRWLRHEAGDFRFLSALSSLTPPFPHSSLLSSSVLPSRRRVEIPGLPSGRFGRVSPPLPRRDRWRGGMEKWVLEVGGGKGFSVRGGSRLPLGVSTAPPPPIFPAAPPLTPSAPYSQAGEEGP